MGIFQGKDSKKVTGGIRRAAFKVKRKAQLGRVPSFTRFSDKEEKDVMRVRGGNLKPRLREINYANVIDKTSGRAKREKIINVLETPSNPEFARRNIITKGTVILVESGKAVVTSRPGQDGVVNAVLLS